VTTVLPPLDSEFCLSADIVLGSAGTYLHHGTPETRTQTAGYALSMGPPRGDGLARIFLELTDLQSTRFDNYLERVRSVPGHRSVLNVDAVEGPSTLERARLYAHRFQLPVESSPEVVKDVAPPDLAEATPGTWVVRHDVDPTALLAPPPDPGAATAPVVEPEPDKPAPIKEVTASVEEGTGPVIEATDLVIEATDLVIEPEPEVVAPVVDARDALTRAPSESAPPPSRKIRFADEVEGGEIATLHRPPPLPTEIEEEEEEPETLLPDPYALSAGIPESGLPDLPAVRAALQKATAALKVKVRDKEWEALPVRITNNYRQLVPTGPHGDPDSDAVWGHLLSLGKAEVLIALRPDQPIHMPLPEEGTVIEDDDTDDVLIGNPATQLTQGSFQTGVQSQTNSGETTGVRAKLSLSTVIGLAEEVTGIKFGPLVSGTANLSKRGTSHAIDAERGRVQDLRGESTLYSYRPNWLIRIRTDPSKPWRTIDPLTIEPTGTPRRLRLWMPNNYLRPADRQVIATLPKSMAGNTERLPEMLFASGFTALPDLIDGITALLLKSKVKAKIGSALRYQLNQRVYNLDNHLDRTTNNKELGYRFTLTQRGSVVATVHIRARRRGNERRVGSSSDTEHLEMVRTGIVAQAGSHDVSHSSTLQFIFELTLGLGKIIALAIGVALGQSWSRADGFAGARNSLNVMVTRFQKWVAAYLLDMEYTATVFTPDGPAEGYTTDPYRGYSLLRLAEPDAFAHRFRIDRKAVLPGHRIGLGRVDYHPQALRHTAPEGDEPRGIMPPERMYLGHGPGNALVKVSRDLEPQMRELLMPVLQREKYAPKNLANPFLGGRRRWWRRTDFNSRMDNVDLVHKKISSEAFDVMYTQAHQDEMSFVLRYRGPFQRLHTARVVLSAEQDLSRETRLDGTSVHHVRRTKEFHLVNLIMGLDVLSQSTSGGTKLVFTLLKIRIMKILSWLSGLRGGVDYQHGISASDAVNLIINGVQLREYAHAIDIFRVWSTWRLRIEFDDGRVWRSPTALRAPADVMIMPLVNEPDEEPVATAEPPRAPTEPRVLDEAIVFFADTTDVHAAAHRLRNAPTQPGRFGDEELAQFTSNTAMSAHLKEMAYGAYTTDTFFEPHLVRRNRLDAVSIAAQLGVSEFIGTSPDAFVSGLIDLALAEAGQVSSKVRAIVIELLGLSVGGKVGHAGGAMSGDLAFRRRFGRSLHERFARTFGRELLRLNFERFHMFRMDVTYEIHAAMERHGMFVPSRKKLPDATTIGPRKVEYGLAESDALAHYGLGRLPSGQKQLVDTFTRWAAGDLHLPGNTVARALARWDAERLARADATGTLDTADQLRRREWAERLVNLHEAGTLPVRDADARARFAEAFTLPLSTPVTPYADMMLPPWMSEPGQQALGPHGVRRLSVRGDKPLVDLVFDTLDQVAPGMVTPPANRWLARRSKVLWGFKRNGRIIGTLQGGIDGLQAVLAGTRPHSLLDQMMGPEGVTITLVHQIGWLLADVIELNLQTTLTSPPVYTELEAASGLEIYGHRYRAESETRGSDFGNSVGFGGGGGADGVTGMGSGSAAAGYSRSTNTATVLTEEPTRYDHVGRWGAEATHDTTVAAQAKYMPGRPLNNLLVAAYRKLWRRKTKAGATHPGDVVLQLPKSLAEMRHFQGPQRMPDLSALPDLFEDVDDAHPDTALLDDALRAAKELAAQALGRKANDPKYRSVLSLETVTSRLAMTYAVPTAIGGKRAELARGSFLSDHPSKRMRLYLTGDLFDAEIVGPVENAGTSLYTKFQAGVSASGANDRWRLSGSANVDGTAITSPPPGEGQSVNPGQQYQSGSGADAVAPRGQRSSYTGNDRDELHPKKKGPLTLVRLKGRFFLDAERWRHAPVGKPRHDGNYRSAAMTGNYYVEVPTAKLDRFMRKAAALREQRTADRAPTAWPAPKLWSPRFDLDLMLARFARQGYGASHSPRQVAREVRNRVHPREGFQAVLRYDTRRAAQTVLAAVREWGVAELSAKRPAIAEKIFNRQPLNPWTTDDDYEELTEEIILAVNAAQPAGAGPVALPPEVAVLALDPLQTARTIAHESYTGIDLRVTGRDGTVTTHRVGFTGAVYPVAPDGKVHSATDAVATLPEDLRHTLEVVDLPADTLTQVYRDAGVRAKTFEQAVREAVGDLAGTQADRLALASWLTAADWTRAQRVHTRHPHLLDDPAMRSIVFRMSRAHPGRFTEHALVARLAAQGQAEPAYRYLTAADTTGRRAALSALLTGFAPRVLANTVVLARTRATQPVDRADAAALAAVRLAVRGDVRQAAHVLAAENHGWTEFDRFYWLDLIHDTKVVPATQAAAMSRLAPFVAKCPE
jgi:hypothetical protein